MHGQTPLKPCSSFNVRNQVYEQEIQNENCSQSMCTSNSVSYSIYSPKTENRDVRACFSISMSERTDRFSQNLVWLLTVYDTLTPYFLNYLFRSWVGSKVKIEFPPHRRYSASVTENKQLMLYVRSRQHGS
jgi:hypothetical protein